MNQICIATNSKEGTYLEVLIGSQFNNVEVKRRLSN